MLYEGDIKILLIFSTQLSKLLLVWLLTLSKACVSAVLCTFWFRDCSLFIGSTGLVFCGKDPWKCSCPVNKNLQKVGVPSVEGRKKSMSRIITPYSHCAGGTICNEQQSLPLTAGG